MDLHTVVDTTAHVTLMAAFLSAFYFLYVDRVEGEIVSAALDNVVDAAINQSNAARGFDITKNSKARAIVAKLELPADITASDAEVDAMNAKTIKHAGFIMGPLVGTGVIAVAAMWYFGQRSEQFQLPVGSARHFGAASAKWVALSNLNMLAGVAMTEFLFLLLVARNFRALSVGTVEAETAAATIKWSQS